MPRDARSDWTRAWVQGSPVPVRRRCLARIWADRAVVVAGGEPANERDGVFIGGAGVLSGPGQRHGQVGVVAALPDDPKCGDIGRPVKGDDDFGDDRAQELLAVAVRRARRIEDLAHAGTGARHPRQFLFGQRRRAGGPAACAGRSRRSAPHRACPPRHVPCVRATNRFSGSTASYWRRGAVGLVAGTLDGQLEGDQPGPVLGLGVGERPRGRGQRGRCEHGGQLPQHGLLDQLAIPTPTQRRAFQLLDQAVPLTLA